MMNDTLNTILLLFETDFDLAIIAMKSHEINHDDLIDAINEWKVMKDFNEIAVTSLSDSSHFMIMYHLLINIGWREAMFNYINTISAPITHHTGGGFNGAKFIYNIIKHNYYDKD